MYKKNEYGNVCIKEESRVFIVCRRHPDVRMQRIGENSTFLSASVHRSDDPGTERRARNSIKPRWERRKKKRKERKKRNGRLKKLVLPVTQNRDAAVGRSVAARPEIRVARAFYERKAGGEE